MKKKISLVVLIILVLVSGLVLFACSPITNEIPPLYVVFDGDIDGGVYSINLYDIAMTEYIYTEEGTEVTGDGWELSKLLEYLTMRVSDNYLFITSATDGVSALIELPLTDKMYLYDDGSKVSAKGPNYPKCTGIKNISEITIIAKDSEDILETINSLPNTKPNLITQSDYGIKILTSEKTDLKTFGESKLKLFSLSAENLMGENKANKYLPNNAMTVNSFTGRDNNIIYLENGDIIKNADNIQLGWKHGKIIVKDTKAPILGFVTNTTRTILDAYSEIKISIDNNEKVMLILPDGFSWIQANALENDLDILKASLSKGYASATHRAISPVALASIVTGKSPYITGINFKEGESRAVLKPNAQDIFEYATSKDKIVKYIEGTGNLIITSVEPVYSLNDTEIYNNAKAAINEGIDFIFVHFHEIDDVNHEYGPLSKEAKIKCMEIDSYVKDLKMQFDGKVIIVSDHGHITLVNENDKNYGDHGYFDHQDMYVPYFVFNK